MGEVNAVQLKRTGGTLMASDTKVEAGTPRRIQRLRVKGWRMPAGAIYVGRPSKWGNPFKVGDWVRGWRASLPTNIIRPEEAVELFRRDAMHPQAGLIFRENAQRELRGKDLACWCPLDQPCHADVLLEIANAKEADHGR
jgi:hypothetical protein